MEPTTSRSAAGKPETKEPQGPPIPKFMFKLANPLMKLMLNSPLHGQMSDRLMVLSFTGRKSGKRFSTPVGYVRQGSRILVFTHSPWRHNFEEPAPVRMRIQGQTVNGTARLVHDPQRIKGMVQALNAAHGPDMSRRMGFFVDNVDSASPQAVLDATRGTYFIEIETHNGGK